jgi:Protein of unknown function (DUF2384)
MEETISEVELSLDTVRAAAREQAARSSMRHVAREAGVKVGATKKFVDGSVPYKRNARLWRRWYLRQAFGYVPKEDGESDPYFLILVRLQSAARVFASDAELAAALGVGPRKPARWRAGHPPDRESRDRIVALDAVVELLGAFLPPSGIPRWLDEPSPHLGGRRPVEVLQAGRLSEVVAAVEAERTAALAPRSP